MTPLPLAISHLLSQQRGAWPSWFSKANPPVSGGRSPFLYGTVPHTYRSLFPQPIPPRPRTTSIPWASKTPLSRNADNHHPLPFAGIIVCHRLAEGSNRMTTSHEVTSFVELLLAAVAPHRREELVPYRLLRRSSAACELAERWTPSNITPPIIDLHVVPTNTHPTTALHAPGQLHSTTQENYASAFVNMGSSRAITLSVIAPGS